MQEKFGTPGPELIAYSHQNPRRVVAAALGVTSIVLAPVFGQLSSSGDGNDISGFYFGEGDGGD
jgi:hypothetical protein